MSDHRRIPKINPEVRIGNYIIGETLGTGSFGKVKVGIHRSTKVKVAIKIVNREKIKALDVAGKLRREIQNLWLFRHPHIIKLYQVISTPTDIFMIMEYVSGGELFDHIVNSVRLSEQHARKFFQQIISGVDYCHRHKVVHRDLKPENLLLDSNKNVKIADFGLSNIMQDGEFLRTSCGSPNYAAPEVISGKLYAGPEVDIWSCGVILYALLCGTLPFDDENISVLFNKIKSGYFRMPDSLSGPVKDIIRRMLTTDPISRITIVEIKKHPWFIVDLPSHLFPQDRDEDASIIDKDAICEVCKACNVSEREVLAALISNDPSDQLSIAYNLIIDNKRFGSELNPDEVNNFYVATGSESGSVPGSLQNEKMFFPDGHFDENSSISGGRSSSGNTTQNSSGNVNRPHPERMPACLSLTRTLDPVESPAGRKISSNSPQAGSGQTTHQSNTNNSNVTPTSASAMATGAAIVAGMKRFKWHLGIRSQSKPWDIMHEVYKAMVSLGYEWKIINPFNIRVRKWNPILNHYSKIMLQLYQVDVKSFLLDFKCIEDSNSNSGSIGDSVCDMNARSRKTSAPSTTTSFNDSRQDSNNSPQPLSNEISSSTPLHQQQQAPHQPTTQLRHQTMEFFEMCTQLITALAR